MEAGGILLTHRAGELRRGLWEVGRDRVRRLREQLVSCRASHVGSRCGWGAAAAAHAAVAAATTHHRVGLSHHAKLRVGVVEAVHLAGESRTDQPEVSLVLVTVGIHL